MTEQRPPAEAETQAPDSLFPPEEVQVAYTEDTYGSIGAATLHANLTLEAMTERTPALFLRDLRIYLCRPENVVAKRRKPPDEYQPALDDLLAIREAHNDRTEQEISAAVAGRFLTNIIVFRQATGLGAEDHPELTPSFLNKLYGMYVDDVAAFRQHAIQKPDLMALFHPGHIVSILEAQIADHPFLVKADIFFAFAAKRGNPQSVLDGLNAEVRHFKEEAEPRLRQEYGFEGDWTLSFIRNLCRHRAGAEVRARKVLDAMRDLRTKYPKARLSSIESWAKGTVVERAKKADGLQELLSDLPDITCEEEEVARGEEKLERIREARLSGVLDRKAGLVNARWSSDATKVVRLAEANWHDAFDAIDIEKEAPRIWAAAKGYNDILSEEDARLVMSMESGHLYHMLVAFALDVTALQQEGPAWAASRVAHYHAPGVYTRYKEQYADDPLITPTVLTKIIVDAPRIIDRQIERWFATMHALKQFEGQVTPGNLRRFAHIPDAFPLVEACVTFGSEARQEHHWVARHDTEYFFVTRKEEPEKKFAAWVKKVEQIRELYPKRKDLSLHRRKQLAKQEGSAQDVVEAYDARTKEILDLYKREPRIRRSYARWWASNAPDSYLDIAKGHLASCDKVEETLKELVIELEYPAIFGRIAFKSSDPKRSAEAYVERRSWLEAAVQDSHNVHIEQWMIDHAAALTDTQTDYLVALVNFFARLKAQGELNVYLDENVSNVSRSRRSRTKHETIATPISLDEPAQNRELIEEYLSWLSVLDRQAVAVVFGFDDDADKSELEKDLEVDDLDKYVFEEVVPHLLKLSNQRM